MGFVRRAITSALDLANLKRHNDNFADIETDLTEHRGRIAVAETKLTTQNDRIDNIVASSGESNLEIVDAREDYGTLRERLDTEFGGVNAQLAEKVNQIDLDTTNQIVANTLSKSIFSLNTLTKIASFNRTYYLDANNNIKTDDFSTNATSWWVADSVNEIEFTLSTESKWILIGLGANYENYCVAINLMGFPERYISKLFPGSTNHLSTSMVYPEGAVGDVCRARYEGNIFKIFKKNGSTFNLWFQVDTTTYADIVYRRIGFAHTFKSASYIACTNFMNLNNLPTSGTLPHVKISKWHNKKWVTNGDSITWYDKHPFTYWPGHETEIAVGYQSVVNEKVSSFAEIKNNGVSGTPMTNNGSSSGVVIGKTVNYTLYDLVTIAHGTNDFKLNCPIGALGSIGDTTFNEATFYGAYRSLVEYILTRKPTIKLVLFTPLQRDNDGYDINFTNTAGHKLIDYVTAIKSIGQMYGLPVLDLYSSSEFNKFTLSTYTYDGLHPNNVGYKIMGEKIYNFIENVI